MGAERLYGDGSPEPAYLFPLDTAKTFTVTLPDHRGLPMALPLRSKSGRDEDKFASLGLSVIPARSVEGIRIDCPGTHFEARILHRVDMADGSLDESVAEAHYRKDGLHVFYFAEIVDRYTVYRQEISRS